MSTLGPLTGHLLPWLLCLLTYLLGRLLRRQLFHLYDIRVHSGSNLVKTFRVDTSSSLVRWSIMRIHLLFESSKMNCLVGYHCPFFIEINARKNGHLDKFTRAQPHAETLKILRYDTRRAQAFSFPTVLLATDSIGLQKKQR